LPTAAFGTICIFLSVYSAFKQKTGAKEGQLDGVPGVQGEDGEKGKGIHRAGLPHSIGILMHMKLFTRFFILSALLKGKFSWIMGCISYLESSCIFLGVLLSIETILCVVLYQKQRLLDV
jgi:hypothetical protein